MQFQIDGLAPRRLCCPVGWGQFSAAQVFVNHRQFGVLVTNKLLREPFMGQVVGQAGCERQSMRNYLSNFMDLARW
jgi:hypothetical protein